MRIDCHMHLSHQPKRWGFTPAQAVVAARRLGIDRFCACDVSTDLYVEPKAIRRMNSFILKAMRQFPDAILGLCFIHPGHVRHAQDEITRCVVDGGMAGLKLYHQHFMDEPVVFPVIERCIDLGVPILMHASHVTDPKALSQQPRLSDAMHFHRAAQRYPEAMLIHGHLPGGGDWEWGIKWLRKTPSVFVDTSGSVIDQGVIERMVAELGTRRILFGTDMQYERGVGKLLSARITDSQRRAVFGENMARILAPEKSVIIDASTYVGHWPFRSLPENTVRDLLRWMDRCGIDKALVSPIHAMFYQDAHQANRELHRETKRHRDRLIPLATLNPGYPGWEDDLRECRERFGMTGVRLVPQYHDYTLDQPCARQIVEAATGLKMVVSLMGRVVDNRYRHHLDQPREIAEDHLLKLFKAVPQARFLLVNFATVPGDRRWDRPAVWMDMCRFRAAPAPKLQKLIDRIGADRVVFGTSMLFRYPMPALLAMELLDAPGRVKQRILSGNLAALLRVRKA